MVQHSANNETIIPARYGKAVKIKNSQAIKIINTFGTQVIDCWAWNSEDTGEYMSMEATRVWTQRLNPIVGDSYVTNKRNPILTVVEDTSPGVHDTFMAACDKQRYERLGVSGYHRNCLDNVVEALSEIGVTVPTPTLASLNIFMNIMVEQDGRSLSTLPTVSKPGDYITLKAEMDCIIGLSSCPQDIVSIQGQGDNTPRDAKYSILESGFPDLPPSQAWIP